MTVIASDRRPWRDLLDPWLLAALALGLVLRFTSLGHGLPHVYNPDEVSILSRALGMASGDLNPHNFLYPSLYFYILAAATGASALVAMAAGQVHSLAQFEARFWQDPTTVYLVGRGLSAAAGVITIVAVYALALRVGDRIVARVAAILMAVAYVPVRDAHFLKHDVPATLLIVGAVAASWWVWQRGRTRDYVLAGASVGVASALHYPAALVVVALLAAHVLRTRHSVAELLGVRLWLAALTAITAFAVCSPYVLIDVTTALRDIQANRAIIIERAQRTYGAFGSAMPQLEILRTQGAGLAWLIAAVVGCVALVRRSVSAFAWLAAFPVVFFLFLSNTWPFGRTANPLYPVLAVMGGAGLVWLSRRFGRFAMPVLVALTALTMAQPLVSSVLFDYLVAQTDTRTLAMQWIEAHVTAGAGIAVEPYSVQLQPTRAQVTAALQAAGIQPDRAGRRARTLLARVPYPSPAYRLFHIGEGGMDEDKIYIPPQAFSRGVSETTQLAPCVDYIVLKSEAPYGANPLSLVVAGYSRLVHKEDPFSTSTGRGDGFLPDFDVKPSLGVTRPGPVIEIWQVRNRCPEGATQQ